MSPLLLGWTPQEAWLCTSLVPSALYVALPGGGWLRPSGLLAAPAQLSLLPSGNTLLLTLPASARSARLRLEPDASAPQPWRDEWWLELSHAGKRHGLLAGEAPLELALQKGAPLTLEVRKRARTLALSLGGEPLAAPLQDASFHRYTKQSSRSTAPTPPAPVPAFMTPTLLEREPWWEVDLGAVAHVHEVTVELAQVPLDAWLEVHAYAFATPRGAPPARAFRVRAEAEREQRFPVGELARFLRVRLEPQFGGRVSLALRSLRADVVPLYASTLRDTLRRAFALHAKRVLFAPVREGEGPEPVRYREAWAQAESLGRGLARRLEGDPAALRDGRVVLALVLRNSPPWVLADVASVQRGYVVVPLAPEDPPERLAAILDRVRPSCVLGEGAALARLAPLLREPPSLWVCVEREAPPAELQGAALGLAELLAEGASAQVPAPTLRREEELYTVLFTSGSTGAPKGVMRSYGTFRAMLESYGGAQAVRHLSFQPLSHLSERMYLPALLVQGATIAFSQGGARLLEELEAFGPTLLSSVPRLFEVLRASYERRLRAALEAEPEAPREALEARERARVRAAFGPHLEALSVGSAPVTRELRAFLERCFSDLWVTEGYGSTEVGTIAVDGKVQEGVKVKLVPLPGAPERVEGEPERGELWVRTPHMSAGYLGDASATASSLDAEGFWATGDLGERAPDGSVRVLGRLRNTVKLAQGEFVSAERVEEALAGAPVAERVFAYVVSGAPGLAALVVPEREALARLLGAPAESALEALVARPEAPAAVLRALRAQGQARGLAAWELPRGALLTAEPFAVHNGLLTTSGKVSRPGLAARFGEALEALARGGTEPSAEPAGGTLEERAVRAASKVLGRAVELDTPLGESAGVDSLAAAELLGALGDALRREVPLRAWFGAGSLRGLLARLRGEQREGEGDEVERWLARPFSLPAGLEAPRVPARVLLLTGATGFLGAHLLEALLARSGASVWCLVRAKDDAEALARLRSTAQRYELALSSWDRVRALAGDLEAPRLGLSEARYEELAGAADAVLHAGARVRWIATVEALRGPNLEGTEALLELATKARLKPVHFVSTISTAPAAGAEGATLTLEQARAGTPYGYTKWASEQRVRRAGEAGLPVAVYRPAMIAAHSARGHGNAEDFLHRYVLGAASLGLYLELEGARLDLTPVDYVAQGIAALALAHPLGGGVHHLANVEQSPTYASLGRSLRALGVRVEPSGYERFRAALLASRGSPLGALASFFPAEGFGLGMGPWPCERTVRELEGLGVRRPPIDAAVLGAWVRALRREGLLPPA